MELGVYSLFKVDVRNLVKNRLYLTKETHIQPSVYESWPFYEYEFFLEDYKEWVEEQNKQNEEQNKQMNSGGGYKPPDMSSLSKGFKMPKMPKI